MPASETTRERLMSAAFALFEERGYEAASVEDIAARAGVGRTTAFRQFGSKEALIFPDHRALLRRADARLSAASAEAIPAEVISVATSVFDHYLAEGDRARARYRLTTSVPVLRDFETTTVSRYVRLFSAHLDRAMPDDWNGSLRAEMFANAVVTAHNHVLRRWLRGDTDDPKPDLMEALALPWTILHGTPKVQTAVIVMTTDEPIESLGPRLRTVIADAAPKRP
ncbi:MAG: helix-turn-helix domain-containing protein [Mycobacterium sp.]